MTASHKVDGLVFRIKCLVPKLYSKWILGKNGVVQLVKKSKGIDSNKISHLWYENEEQHKVSWYSPKKVGKNVTKSQKSKGVKPFDLLQVHLSRTFNPTWKKQKYNKEHNVFIPNSYRGDRYK